MLGMPGQLVEHQTGMWVEAVEPHALLKSIDVPLDLPVISVDRVSDDRVLGLMRRQAGGYLLSLALVPPLQPGDQAKVEYFLNLRPEADVLHRFRRVIPATGFTSLKMSVAFDGRNLPSAVYWAEWADESPNSPIVPGSEVPLDLEPIDNRQSDPPQDAHWETGPVAGKVVGMYWRW